MHNKDVSQSISHTLMLTLMMLVLSGCLSEEESETAFSGSTGSTPVNGVPVISGNPAGAVKIGEAYSFTPNASDTDNDPLTFAIESKPLWASFDTDTGELSGQPTLGNVGTYSNILISVRDATASASLPRFSIAVNQVGTLSTTLSWTPPIENEDGTALTDLDGYKIYWGTTPGNYPNSVTISNEGITTYVVDNLTPGTYEFVATSFNASGVESAYSNPATKVVN
jgi:hypothetical protein